MENHQIIVAIFFLQFTHTGLSYQLCIKKYAPLSVRCQISRAFGPVGRTYLWYKTYVCRHVHALANPFCVEYRYNVRERGGVGWGWSGGGGGNHLTYVCRLARLLD